MAVNKIVYNGTPLIDLTGDTVTSAGDIVSGKVGHLRDGTQVTGTASSGTDTSDATALASDIVSGKTAYIATGKVNGTFAPQTKSATPSTSAQNITPDSGKYLTKVSVGAIPSDYIKPSGTLNITSNGTHDVKNYASANVSVTGGLTTFVTGTFRKTNSYSTCSVSGLALGGKTPKIVIVSYNGTMTTGTSALRFCYVNQAGESHHFFSFRGSSSSYYGYSLDDNSRVSISVSANAFDIDVDTNHSSSSRYWATQHNYVYYVWA